MPINITPHQPSSAIGRLPTLGTLLLALALTGCTTGHWVRDGGTEAELHRDQFGCERESAQMYPAMPRQSTYGPATTTETSNCKTKGNTKTCKKSTEEAMTYTTDDNSSARYDAFSSCMRANGYWFQEDR
ncbi:hypothetical protein SAMN05216359_103386 [Roseateles sp. YR242]|uniref:hypothetical protein n=1 Tax=Roseateles sp. YR242 TaxID=1855305 RepID=UPI0008ABC351|nr:hypothetical protein [Roseateles sp. YR242]SEK86404.1 hypothetical protein SAMN05216359_103386 [Roseateles sp. YR242]